MKTRLVFILAALLFGTYNLKSQESFGLSLSEFSITDLPALQSFAWAQHDNKVIFIGGRKDGLHKRRPFEAFLATGNNAEIILVNMNDRSVIKSSLSVLNMALEEQLQSTNMNFEQVGDKLYIIGGYAYSATAGDHITFDDLTIVDLPGLISAMETNQSIDAHFSQISDPIFEVTGGYLDYSDGQFYLAGGQSFMGRYNPMGPNHGPGFTQQYTDEIRRFEIEENGGNYTLKNIKRFTSTQVLHRRDYNMAPQRFPDGEIGFTMFSGVFQIKADLPWLDVVDLRSDSFYLRTGFEQKLNQYHSAHLVLFDTIKNANYTLFFGGMAQFYYDGSHLVEDTDVPFVKTISQVTRNANNELSELAYSLEMPSLLGAGAEFIPVHNANFYNEYDMLDVQKLPNSSTLVGYVIGGIESSAPNVFFNNAANTSWASTKLFEVYIDKGTTGITHEKTELNELKVYPNPSTGKFKIDLKDPKLQGGSSIRLTNIKGELVREIIIEENEQIELNIEDLPNAQYHLQLFNGKQAISPISRLIKQKP